jgi:hypothetical protein
MWKLEITFYGPFRWFHIIASLSMADRILKLVIEPLRV